MAAEKSGEISSEKVKPSTLIPTEGHHHKGMNGGGHDVHRLQIAVKFLNAATEIKLRDEEAGRKSGLEGDYDWALKGFPLQDAEPYLLFLCSATAPIGTRKPNLIPDLWILLMNTPKLSRFM